MLDALGERRRRARAARHRARTRRSRRRARATSSERLRALDTARRRGLLPLRDGGARRRRAADRAVGRGGRHDDEPRGPGHPAAAGRRRRPRACAPTSRSSARWRSALGEGEPLPFRRRRRGLRRAAPRRRAAVSPTTRASPTRRIDARGRCLLALPVRRSPGHAAPLRRALPDAERPRALPRRAARATPPRSPTPSIPLLPHHRAGARAVPVGHADAAGRASSTELAPEPLVEIHPAARAAARSGRGRPRHARDAPRRGGVRACGSTTRHPRGHRVRAVPLGRRAARPTA